MKAKSIVLDAQKNIYSVWLDEDSIHSYWSNQNKAEEILSALQIDYEDSFICEIRVDDNIKTCVGHVVHMNLTTGERMLDLDESEYLCTITTVRNENVNEIDVGPLNYDINLIFPASRIRFRNHYWMTRRQTSLYSNDKQVVWNNCQIFSIGETLEQAMSEAERFRSEEIQRFKNLPQLQCHTCGGNECKDWNSRNTMGLRLTTQNNPEDQWIWFCSDECHEKHIPFPIYYQEPPF